MNKKEALKVLEVGKSMVQLKGQNNKYIMLNGKIIDSDGLNCTSWFKMFAPDLDWVKIKSDFVDKKEFQEFLSKETGLKAEVFPNSREVVFYGTDIQVYKLAYKYKELESLISEHTEDWFSVFFPNFISIETAKTLK